ncbi:hypothetical protein LguiB_002542 [Lonicera macranthoides]
MRTRQRNTLHCITKNITLQKRILKSPNSTTIITQSMIKTQMKTKFGNSIYINHRLHNSNKRNTKNLNNLLETSNRGGIRNTLNVPELEINHDKCL